MANRSVPFRSESLVLNSRTFAGFAGRTFDRPMTIRGTVIKTAILMVMAIFGAACSWPLVGRHLSSDAFWVVAPSAMVFAFWLALVVSTQPKAAPFTAPIYAFLEGGALGLLSVGLEEISPGMLLPAVLMSFATLPSLLTLYWLKGFDIRPGVGLGLSAIVMTVGLVGGIVASAQLLGADVLQWMNEAEPLGLIVSAFVLLLAAINLVLDFVLIESGVRNRAPAYMEWYAGFGLLVSLIWLYLEVLKLLVQIALSGAFENRSDN